ncbi:MAG: hypothetical protein NFW04_17190 [Candidatus Accumulibacter sp.]|uniref:hypothetical protein n=1 Tax=Accumulibacter sp. TaxID=2053492 RepID=UPI0025D24DDD|nr:hypothetical protein [Accumulibacter sp.]MCM8600363.1 hypothetical protein [Accumulibacter sp.]MCM8664596.1 hypothetical protein [Accumulibacter sp.]HNC19614.1 hypothetical protein [Accumulibacter sp.]
MEPSPTTSIPDRALVLAVLRRISEQRPLLMLPEELDGYGARWLLDGQQVLPPIAKYLMRMGFVAERGATELGAIRFLLTESGSRFRENGLLWWKGLGLLQRLQVRVFG